MNAKITLYKKDSKGKIREWSIWTENGDLVQEAGLIDGKLVEHRKTCKVKNAGKSNETTPFQQAAAEMGSAILSKRYEGYFLTKEGAKNESVLLPMLAKSYGDHSKKIDWNKDVWVQPKLDGFRCRCQCIISNNKIDLFSRKNLPYKGLPTLKKELLKLYENLVENKKANLHLDGELYIHDIPFENLSSSIKRAQHRPGYDIKNIEFRIYDCFSLDDMKISFEDRTKFLKSLIPNKHNNLKYVKTEVVKSLDEFKEYFSLFMSEGYEGIMVRNLRSPYEISKRSSHLQKYKEFSDDEFEIIGFQEGSGVDEKTVIWKCKTVGGEEFSVRPKGDLDHRRNLFKNAKKYIGKQLTVKYQELSETGVPRFPVGKDIRD